jgi:uroporphyrin-III C-methyltransferase / precorrin-2 dehydrogenase / sirohydrochlorin ferrochelatase
MKSKGQTGKVYFIGAGPGDPELLTMKGLRLLQNSDVILHDRLVSAEILHFAKPDAEIILTGKQKGGAKCTPQSAINDLMVDFALQGKNVARLKGGDVSFFSNILDELEAVTAHHIPFEIVPGVTAASGCAAYAGIPITGRGYANAVRFLTLHQTEIFDSSDWKELANSNDTIIFYMSAANTLFVVKQLLEHGANSEIPIVVIEQGTTPNQREYFSDLKSAEEEFKEITFQSPATIIIGSVVKLAQKFKWFDSSANGVYFTELTSFEIE